MRKEITDNYTNFALLGNSIYGINFMYYLFLSQNVSAYYCNKYKKITFCVNKKRCSTWFIFESKVKYVLWIRDITE